MQSYITGYFEKMALTDVIESLRRGGLARNNKPRQPGQFAAYKLVLKMAGNAVDRSLGSASPCNRHEELITGPILPALQHLKSEDIPWHVIPDGLKDQPDPHLAGVLPENLKQTKPFEAMVIMSIKRDFHLLLSQGPSDHTLCVTPNGRAHFVKARFDPDNLALPFQVKSKVPELKNRLKLMKAEEELMIFTTRVKLLLHDYRGRVFMHGFLIRKFDFHPLGGGVSCTAARLPYTDIFRNACCHACNYGEDSDDEPIDRSLCASDTDASFCSCQTSLSYEEEQSSMIGYSPRSSSTFCASVVSSPAKALMAFKDINHNTPVKKRRAPESPVAGPSRKRARHSGPGL